MPFMAPVSQRVRDELEVGVLGVGLDREAQRLHQLEHAGVVDQHEAVDFLQALFARDVHDALDGVVGVVGAVRVHETFAAAARRHQLGARPGLI